MNSKKFDSLGIDGRLLHALSEVGYEQATPIQAEAIPHLLKGKDLLGVAQTGTGKTAAFSLPLLQLLDKQDQPAQPGRPKALIMAPTRELVVQIDGELKAFGKYSPQRHCVIIGGVNAKSQIKAISRGVDIVVATPGRLLDLATSGYLDLSEVSMLVLDEVDRLLDMGFIRDVQRIVKLTPKSRQSLVFSATMPKEVSKLAHEILKNPIRVDISTKEITVKKIDQHVVRVKNKNEKQPVLEQLLRAPSVSRAIVFTRTKHGADKVTKKLLKAGIGACAIHGNKSQNARQRALQNFKDGDTWVLVATDIAARGIDVDAVSHVFNFELPHEPDSYVHRIGRTGRAGASGIACSLVDPSETSRLRAVEKLIKFSPTELEVDWDAIGSIPEVVNFNKPQHSGTEKQGSDQSAKTKSRKPRRSNRSKRRAPATGSRPVRGNQKAA